MSDESDSGIPTGKDVNDRDWKCRDCGIVYCADADSTRYDLPEFCPECGDTIGWINVKDGRRVPDV